MKPSPVAITLTIEESPRPPFTVPRSHELAESSENHAAALLAPFNASSPTVTTTPLPSATSRSARLCRGSSSNTGFVTARPSADVHRRGVAPAPTHRDRDVADDGDPIHPGVIGAMVVRVVRSGSPGRAAVAGRPHGRRLPLTPRLLPPDRDQSRFVASDSLHELGALAGGRRQRLASPGRPVGGDPHGSPGAVRTDRVQRPFHARQPEHGSLCGALDVPRKYRGEGHP